MWFFFFFGAMKDGACPRSYVPDTTPAGAGEPSRRGGAVNAAQSGREWAQGSRDGRSGVFMKCVMLTAARSCLPHARRWDSRTLSHFARGVCTNPSQLAPASRGPASPLPRHTYASTSVPLTPARVSPACHTQAAGSKVNCKSSPCFTSFHPTLAE